MPSPPLGSTHSRTTSGVACHHSPRTANTAERRRALHDITALGLHASLNDVGHCMTSPPLDSTHSRQHWAWNHITALGKHTQSNDVGCGMPSSPFGSTNGRTTSGVACHHHLWAAQMVERRQAWNAIIALGRQTQSNDVGHDMPSSPLGSANGQTTLGMA